MRTRLLIISFCIWFIPYFAGGQSYLHKKNNIWLLRSGIGLNFNSGSPMPAGPSALGYNNTVITNATGTICDASGQLLFYTDGAVIYNKNHVVMGNGWDINHNLYLFNGAFQEEYVARDGIVIVPMPDSADKYYVFVSAYSETGNGASGPDIFYSVVDMHLNGGLGGVEPDRKGVLLDTSVRTLEGLHAVAGNGCNFWLLTVDSLDQSYRAYEINSAGLNTTPVVSVVSNAPAVAPNYHYHHVINVSPDRKKVISLLSAMPAFYSFVQVADFDATTGQVTNQVSFAGGENCFDVAFSPDNTKLYTSGYPMRQYDITTPFPWTALLIGGESLALRLAPDGKIYTAGEFAIAGRINDPNATGLACQFSTMPSLSFLDDFWYGFPNEVPEMIYGDTLSANKKMPLCFGSQGIRLFASDTMGRDYRWNGGGTQNALNVNTAGVYTVTYKTLAPCAFHRDTFTVSHVDFSVDLGADTAYCSMTSVNLNVPVNGATYLWQDASTADHYEVTGSGSYWVKVSKDGCSASDTINLKITDVSQQLGEDLLLCSGTPISLNLQATVPPGAAALWSNGSTGVQLSVNDTGTYWVTVSDMPCTGSDTMRVRTELCTCEVGMPGAFSPNNDGLNDLFRPVMQAACDVRGYDFSIYNRWGQRVFTSYTPGEGWDGLFQGVPAEAGTYFYTLQLQAGSHAEKIVRKGDVILIR